MAETMVVFFLKVKYDSGCWREAICTVCSGQGVIELCFGLEMYDVGGGGGLVSWWMRR